jgi:hypothetical protein
MKYAKYCIGSQMPNVSRLYNGKSNLLYTWICLFPWMMEAFWMKCWLPLQHIECDGRSSTWMRTVYQLIYIIIVGQFKFNSQFLGSGLYQFVQSIQDILSFKIFFWFFTNNTFATTFNQCFSYQALYTLLTIAYIWNQEIVK